jgi:hypothetical protein
MLSTKLWGNGAADDEDQDGWFINRKSDCHSLELTLIF